MTFYGYRRPDGRVGVRNKVLILPASVCASDTTRIISQQVEGSVTFNNQQGCSQVGPDQQLTMDVMAGYAANPNIYGTVVVSLGCENCQMDLVTAAIRERTNKPMEQVIIQEAGGTLKAVEAAVRYAKQMVAEASLLQKEEFPISELIVGTECGGSDPTSGLAANPAIGAMSDLLVAAGGTSILSETSEFIGAEHILARRAVNREVHDRIYEITTRFEKHFHLVGEDVRAGNPSPGNKAGDGHHHAGGEIPGLHPQGRPQPDSGGVRLRQAGAGQARPGDYGYTGQRSLFRGGHGGRRRAGGGVLQRPGIPGGQPHRACGKDHRQ